MKVFTQKDIVRTTDYKGFTYVRIYANKEELIDSPMWYHKRGLMQTATGYGRKLNSGLKINFEGKLYRIYVCQYSNAGTAYFTMKGERIIVS